MRLLLKKMKIQRYYSEKQLSAKYSQIYEFHESHLVFLITRETCFINVIVSYVQLCVSKCPISHPKSPNCPQMSKTDIILYRAYIYIYILL